MASPPTQVASAVGAPSRARDRREDRGSAARERPGPYARSGEPSVRGLATELHQRLTDREDHRPTLRVLTHRGLSQSSYNLGVRCRLHRVPPLLPKELP